MKKNLLQLILPVLALILSLSACSDKNPKTEYTNVLPANTTEVAVVNVKDILTKSGLKDDISREIRQSMIGIFLGGNNRTLSPELETLVKDPAQTGIDWSAPVYVFNAPSLRTTAAAIKVADLQKFETLLSLLAKENRCTAPVKADGYHTVEIKDASTLLAYNNGTLLAVFGSSSLFKKLHPAIGELMKQPADKSLHATPHYASMMEQKGDIRLLVTPEELPLDVRGVLKWPHGTQLEGCILFENGRIYATLQRAGFKGNTNESNQPFHPKNSRELQQAMLSMARGTPFNIELTTEELLTLSNMRVLVEYGGNAPEINALYQGILKIESVNVRGNSSRATFTITLNEKNQNALKQLVDFAKQFAGL